MSRAPRILRTVPGSDYTNHMQRQNSMDSISSLGLPPTPSRSNTPLQPIRPYSPQSPNLIPQVMPINSDEEKEVLTLASEINRLKKNQTA